MKSLVFSLITIIGAAMLGLFLIQERLIFFPQRISSYQGELLRRNKRVTELRIRTPDNTNLHGWLVKNGRENRLPLVIYYGGNAEEISPMINESPHFKDWALLLMNYRGYGSSEGKPGEKELFADALFLYDAVASRADIDKRKIIVFGRSLGTGVAVYVARHRAVNGVILVTPYDSITSVAGEKFFYLPITLLLKHKFDSLSRAPFITAPMLALVAAGDTIVPPRHAKRLIEKWGGKTTTRVIHDTDHNAIDNKEEYWSSIREFLELIRG